LIESSWLRGGGKRLWLIDRIDGLKEKDTGSYDQLGANPEGVGALVAEMMSYQRAASNLKARMYLEA